MKKNLEGIMENELLKAYAEVDVILSYMKDIYVEKIPLKMRDLFKNEKLQGYEPNINPKIPLDEQNLQGKTYAILAMLNLNYWCKDENEKKELIAIYAENDKKRESELKEKYNPDNLFRKKELQKEKLKKGRLEENTSLVEYKENNFFKRIIKKIISFFRFK